MTASTCFTMNGAADAAPNDRPENESANNRHLRSMGPSISEVRVGHGGGGGDRSPRGAPGDAGVAHRSHGRADDGGRLISDERGGIDRAERESGEREREQQEFAKHGVPLSVRRLRRLEVD